MMIRSGKEHISSSRINCESDTDVVVPGSADVVVVDANERKYDCIGTDEDDPEDLDHSVYKPCTTAVLNTTRSMSHQKNDPVETMYEKETTNRGLEVSGCGDKSNINDYNTTDTAVAMGTTTDHTIVTPPPPTIQSLLTPTATPPPTTTTTPNHHLYKPLIITKLWWEQFITLVLKNFLMKRRTMGATLAEWFSPSIILCLLVLAKSMATISRDTAHTYSTINQMNVTGDWLHVWSTLEQNTTLQQSEGHNIFWNDNHHQQPQYNDTNSTRRLRSVEQQQDYKFEEHSEFTSKVTMHGGEEGLSVFHHSSWENNESNGLYPLDTLTYSIREWLLSVSHWYHEAVRQQEQQQEKPLSSKNRDLTNVNPIHTTRKGRRGLQETNVSTTATATENEMDYVDSSSNGINHKTEPNTTYEILNRAFFDIKQILTNPTYIPKLDEYLEISRVLNRYVNASALPGLFEDTTPGRWLQNLITIGTIHISPSSSVRSQQFYEYLNKTYYPDVMIHLVHGNEPIESSQTMNDSTNTTTTTVLTIRLHETEAVALKYIDLNRKKERTWALLDFSLWPVREPGSDENNSNASTTTLGATGINGILGTSSSRSMRVQRNYFTDPMYKIRMNYTTLPNTAFIYYPADVGLRKHYQKYYLSGFLTLQRTVNEFAFSVSTPRTDTAADNSTTPADTCYDFLPGYGTIDEVWSMPMPTHSYETSDFYTAVGFLLGFVVVMAYLFPFARLIKNVVEEKETKMKEMLLIAGVHESAHWLSWVFTANISFFIIAIFVAITLGGNVLKYSNKLYLFGFIALFSTSSVGLCLVICSFFSKAKLAAIIGPIGLFATVLPRYLFLDSNRNEATIPKRFASLLPATAFAFGFDVIVEYEAAGIGIQSYNASEGAYSLHTAIGFLIFDTFLYTVLAWYFGQVLPQQYGKARPWHFVVNPLFWFKNFFVPGAPFGSNEEEEEYSNGDTYDDNNPMNNHHEADVDVAALPFVQIKKVTKIYNRKNDPALDNVSLHFNQNQITALLGHNGAGKSSLLGILTGLLHPTKGDCYIDSLSIRNDVFQARQTIGFCAQDNILYDRLTVFEHVQLFLRLKGLSSSKEEVISLVQDVGLIGFLSVYSEALSGGNKRKLCLALALTGDEKQKLLIFDEPTSGMDPSSRRACWECLRRKRLGRAVVLVSHTMSEADLLADRVLIMKEGKLQASGSPLFLKDRFGLGYNLTVVIDDKEAGDLNNKDIGNKCLDVDVEPRGDTLLAFLRQYVVGTKIIRRFGKEITFALPKGYEPLFPAAFEALEANRKKFGVGTFGVENASLEEVFLLLADEKSLATKIDEPTQGRGNELEFMETAVNEPDNLLLTMVSVSWWTQVRLMYWKRYIIQKRDLVGAFFTVIVPTLLVAVVLLILTIDMKISGPAIELSPNLLYKSSLHDNNTTYDVVFGAGNLSKDEDGYDRSDLHLRFESFTEKEFPNSIYKTNISTSSEMSNYLLQTYDDSNHNSRYGAFVLRDIIASEVWVSWNEMNSDLGILLNSSEAQSGLDTQSVKSLTSFLEILSGNNSLYSNLMPLVAAQLISGSRPLASMTEFAPTNVTAYNRNIKTEVSILHNATSPHALGNNLASPLNDPLPLTSEQTLEAKVTLSILSSMFLLIPFCLIPGSFAVFIVKERANKSKYLQLISGCSVSAYWIGNFLWDATLFCMLTVLVILVFLLYGKNVAEVFVGDIQSVLCMILLILGYGFSVIPFAYLFARRFSNHSSAQITVIGATFFTGFIAVNSYYIMVTLEKTKKMAATLFPIFRFWPAFNFGEGLMALSKSHLRKKIYGLGNEPFEWEVTGKYLALLYGLILPYLLLVIILENDNSTSKLDEFRRFIEKIWDKEVLRLHKLRFHDGELVDEDGCILSTASTDEIVLKERSLILNDTENIKTVSPVILKNVWKVYLPPGNVLSQLFCKFIGRVIYNCFGGQGGSSRQALDEEVTRKSHPKVAVKGITVGISRGETFVLLGQNGCGKSTTIGMLSGDIKATWGNVYVAGHEVSGSDPMGVVEARKQIGLCPQIDPLLELMTGRETLTLYAMIRGVPPNRVDSVVQSLLERLTLAPHAHKTSDTYSGGNKRKLSLGIALIGDPSVLLIDESSSGVDPVAQRQIWNLIADVSKGRSVLLTTHSMDEAQALATKTAIMASGQLLCMGSVQHLKSAYLGGYTIDIFLDESSDSCCREEIIDEIIHVILPGSILAEQYGRFLRFDIVPNNETKYTRKTSTTNHEENDLTSLPTLGKTFCVLEHLKQSSERKWKIENYAIKQCSLEQVFVKLITNNTASL